MKKSIMRGTLPLQQSVVKILDPIKKAGFDGIQLGVLRPPLGELSVRSKEPSLSRAECRCCVHTRTRSAARDGQAWRATRCPRLWRHRPTESRADQA